MTTTTKTTNPCPVSTTKPRARRRTTTSKSSTPTPTKPMTVSHADAIAAAVRQELTAQLALIAAAGEHGISAADTHALVRKHWEQRLITLATWLIQSLLLLASGALWLHEQVRRHHFTLQLRQQAQRRLQQATAQLQQRWPQQQEQLQQRHQKVRERISALLSDAGLGNSLIPLPLPAAANDNQHSAD